MTSSEQSIKTYFVKGQMKVKGEKINFSRNIRSTSEEDVKEKIYLHFGSKHHVKRQLIKFDSIKIVKDDNDPVNAVISSSEDPFKYIK